MANELVQVELIANPAVKRTMTMASYRNNSNKWRISGQEQQSAPQPQKKSVEPAAGNTVTEAIPAVMEIKSITTQDGTVEAPFVDPTATKASETVQATVEPSGLIDGLRAQYKAQTGKDADKRWGVKKLSEEIHNLNTPIA